MHNTLAGSLKALSQDDVERIHTASLNILEKTGIVFRLDAALKVLEDVGAIVNRENMVAKIPQQLVDEALKKAPHRFSLIARDSRHNLEIGSGSIFFTNGFGATYVLDSDQAKRRPATLRDLESFTRLCDSLEHVNYVITQCIPQDVPKEALELYITLAMFENTTKHCSPTGFTLQGAQDMIHMAEILMGGQEEFQRKSSIVNPTICSTSPLSYPKDAVERLMEFSRRRVPLSIWSAPMAGATSPATLAGTLVVQNAEVLAGIVLTQLMGQGTPVMYGSGSSLMDMRYGTIALGSPELGLLGIASAQMAHYYGLPYYGTAGLIDSKIPDEQAAYECLLSNMVCALAGVDVIHDGVYGILESAMTANYEQLLISHEMVGMVKRLLGGIKVDDETLAESVIEKVGPRGNFLPQIHTYKFFRLEHWLPQLTDRLPRSEWEQKGAKDILQRAKERVKETLKNHVPEPPPPDVLTELRRYVLERERQILR